LSISQDFGLESSSSVLFFLERPLAVLFVERSPVYVKVFVDLNVTDSEARETFFHLSDTEFTEIPDDVQHDENNHQWPFDTNPALT